MSKNLEDNIETRGIVNPEDGARRSLWQRILHTPEMSVFAALVVQLIAMSIAQPRAFLSVDNIFNILKGMSSIGVMAIGMTLIIITAGIDLSVGSLLAVSAIVTARLLYFGVNPALAMASGLGLGVVLGAINGLIITRGKVNPFITTLGMLSVARGFSYFFAMGIKGSVASNIPVTNGFIRFIGGEYVGPIPVPVIIMLVLVFLFAFLLKNTILGRQIYAVGSNEEAARLSGVNVTGVKITVYAITGGLCALAGLMEAGLLSTAATSAGTGAELAVIAAVVIGGASLMGGRGSIYGAVLGAAIMAVLRNAFVLLHLPAYVQTIAIGVVIVLAVALDRIRVESNK